MNNAFYPDKIRKENLLEYYSSIFNTVEINSTFYRLPAIKTLQGWVSKTGDGFRFSIKLSRRITHYARLENCKEELAKNRIIAEVLGRKLAVVLIQLPPSLKANLPLLLGFLDSMRRVWGDLMPRIAVEFRHNSWLNDDVYSSLRKEGVCVAISDHRQCRVEHSNNVDFLYIRKHGPDGYYGGSYSDEELQSCATLISKHLSVGDVFVYFNNDTHACAPRDAQRLKRLVRVTPV